MGGAWVPQWALKLAVGAEVGYAVGLTGGDHGEHMVMYLSHIHI